MAKNNGSAYGLFSEEDKQVLESAANKTYRSLSSFIRWSSIERANAILSRDDHEQQ